MESRVDKKAYKTIRVTVNGKPVGNALVMDGVTYAPIKKNKRTVGNEASLRFWKNGTV